VLSCWRFSGDGGDLFHFLVGECDSASRKKIDSGKDVTYSCEIVIESGFTRLRFVEMKVYHHKTGEEKVWLLSESVIGRMETECVLKT